MASDLNTMLSSIVDHAWIIALAFIVVMGTMFLIWIKGSSFDLRESFHLMFHSKKTNGISTVGSFFMALSTRMGAGNIIGVSVAIISGGVGSIFWMWIFSIFGASLCFAECTLGQIFKERTNDGLFRGGPAFYAEKGLKNHRLAVALSLIFIVGGFVFAGMEACNLNDSIRILVPNSIFYINSIIIALVVLFFVTRGLKNISKILSVLTPIVAGIWVIAVLVIIVFNFQYIPETFSKIVQAGLDFQALAGGLMGSFIIYGFKRGASSSEGGTGMVASISSSSDDDHPCVQGYVQSLGVFVDIFVICTATAFLLLMCGGNIPTDSDMAIDYLADALSAGLFGNFGYTFVGIILILITFTTTLGLFTLTESNSVYVFRNNKRARTAVILLFTLTVFLMSLQKQDVVWTLVDLVMAVMIVLNIYCLYRLRHYVTRATRDYKEKKKAGEENPVFDVTVLNDLDVSHITEWKPRT